MQAIEFDAVIENGKIEVPDEFHDELRGTVHVAISTRRKRKGKSYLRELIDNPVGILNFKPMTRDEIYDRNS